MIYRFGASTLDTATCELRTGGDLVPVEPQVFALLTLLIENRHRLVGRDEIVEQVWNGRIVSEAAISSRVKSARQALGDDGAAQRMIRTVPKLGFRFVAEVEQAVLVSPQARAPEIEAPPLAARPSIAVLPFTPIRSDPERAWIADALAHDLISELSRLRWLFVIARGSSFQFTLADGMERVRAALGVRYCLSGTVEIDAAVMTVAVELSDTRDGGIVWSDRFRSGVAAVHETRQRIAQAVTSALELQIPLHEADRARLNGPETLDAWSAYHLGLRNLYRFNRDGNALAAALFEKAIALEPAFARAHAGLSFAHFENAFLSFADDAAAAADQARRFAEQSLDHDPLDPFCNLVMGRVFWLGGDLDASLPWLDRAIQLNPNYAQAKYSRAWTETLMGEGAAGQANADAALQLSPLDPLAYGMLGVRALSHMVLDQPAQAADWAERAARAPGAHALIEMIAAVGHGLNGDDARATAWAHSARRRQPGLTQAEFFEAFPMRAAGARQRISQTLDRLGA